MTLSKLAIALVVIFVVIIVALIGEYLFVRYRRHSFSHRSAPTPSHDSRIFSFSDTATKELLYFFRLKPNTSVEPDPHDPPVKNTGGLTLEDQVDVDVDVLKLKEVSRLSRFLSTIKEEEREKEEVESTDGVDFLVKPVEVEMEDVVAVIVDEDDGCTKTVFSTPYDSPVFFTPAESPTRDIMELPVAVVSVCENEDTGDE